jgi:Uncharacterized membrane protein, required for colicin V production
MNVVDIIILICCIPALAQGIRKGFISQATALVSLVLGAWLSFKFAVPVGNWLKEYIEVSGAVLQVISFALILCVVIIVLNLLGKALEGIIKIVLLGWLNRLLGAAFALLKVILLLGLVMILLEALNSTLPIIPAETINESILYSPVKDIADAVFPYLKELIFNK